MKRLLARVPRIQFGEPKSGSVNANPVTTYYLIIVSALLLTIFGLVMGFSASAVARIASEQSPYVAFGRQLVIIAGSVVIAAVAHLLPQRWWYHLALPLFLLALVAQSLVLTPLGVNVGGNRNWIVLPLIGQAQPSEFLKLAIILALARIVAREGARIRDFKQMFVTAGIPIALGIGAVMLGWDMGTAMVLAIACFGALWVAGLPGKWFVGLTLLSIPLLAFLVAKNPTRIRRVLSILPGNGVARDLSAPEQIDHAMWAFGSGGLMGVGPGASREKWNYLQEAHTDFILAILGEEFGLLGTLTVLACLGMLVWAMVRLAMSTSSAFVAVVTGGVATWIGVQAIINIMSVTGIGPVVGVPLPLVSYGGSSFLFTAVAIGVVAGFARAEAGMWVFGAHRADGLAPGYAIRKRSAERVSASRKVHL
ncbi:FtsW/RodA/SpoVE family cell cycle protein [Schaalia suimastitidis]|uniref:FtsW/RodA/SpoVE family cell cycle protein n=1 Tax=Schaalia suimastitidis TaxID=121163 RepID=UPI000400A5E9|nr:putative peptidoglycan glycosyltransferase FtsW [Schaalia suimastitidis]